jgi:tetratricopeptide (TPR) repeat protein
MNILDHFCQRASLCGSALLLCFSLTANADEIQDINKLFKQGKQAQALEKVNTYLASKPKDTQARFLKGLILTEQNKNDEAIRVFSSLTEDYPELPEPYNNLAVLYAGQGQYDKAKIALEMAIRTHPSYATAHENLGDIYAKMASQAYDRALQLDKGNTSTQTKLALIKDLFANSSKTSKPGKATHNEPAATAPAAPAAVAAAPAQATPASSSSANSSANSAILQSVNEWAAAWSSKNVKDYLAHYASDFKTPDGESRSDWESTRNDRIRKPKFIRVGISSTKVQMIDDSHATVSFRQEYKSSTLKSTGGKTLTMVKSGDKWLIQDERSEK